MTLSALRLQSVVGSPRGCGGFVPGNISGLRAAASGGWPPKRLAAARCAVASPSRAALLPAGYTSQKRAPCTSSGQSPLHSGRPCVHPSLRSLAPPLPTATASLGCGGGGKRLGPLPVTAVTTVTMFQTPPPPSKKPSRSSRLGRFQRQADTSPGVAPAVLIADVVVYQQLPGPDV